MSQLTLTQLYDLIKSDQIALERLDAADDQGCAIRCTEIIPPYPKELKLSFIGVLKLYQDEPQVGMVVNRKLRALATKNDLIKDIVDFMGASTPAESYPDFAIPPIRQALTLPEAEGGAGFTVQQVQRILEAGVQPDQVHPWEVELVRCQLHTH